MILIRIIYTLFKRQILKIYYSEQSSKKGFEKMEKLFIDSEGRQYFKPKNDFDLPILRAKELEKRLYRNASGLSDSNLNMFFDAMEKAINGGKKPDIAEIGFLIKEMRRRQDLLLHEDIMFDIVAFTLIREDEDPSVIDTTIHEEKVKQFTKDSKEGLYDFFLQSRVDGIFTLFERFGKRLERIFGGIEGEDPGNESTPERLYHRVRLVNMSENFKEEILWLSKGIPTEKERIERYTIEEYLTLIKYSLEQSKKWQTKS